MGAPPISTWIRAIDKGWFSSFPGLTSNRVRQFCTKKIETAKGHLKLQRQHVQSSQPQNKQLHSKHHKVSVHITELKNLIIMDLTGRYPITSMRGHKYLLIMIDWDSNYIKIIPVKSRKSHTIVNAYKEGYHWFKDRGFTAQLLKLDNEVSKALITAIGEDDLDYQLASPNDHRQNPAERAIQDVKAHFI